MARVACIACEISVIGYLIVIIKIFKYCMTEYSAFSKINTVQTSTVHFQINPVQSSTVHF